MTEDQRLQMFLKELTSLTHRYGIEIRGCGCCGSPELSYLGKDSIYSIESEESLMNAEKLEYDDDAEEYVVHNDNGSVRFL